MASVPLSGSDGPDGEVMLDIEVAGAIAPDAQIVVYFAPNTDAGFLDAITTAVHDTTWRPGIVSISWGGAESSWTQQAMSAMDAALQAAALAMRGVPDVAGNADPQTGYQVRVDGTDLVIGGTSAVAPLWAALIARIGESTGRAPGFWNPQLYGSPAALRDITRGNNGSYEATTGWDGCTGLGTPNGSKLAGL